MPVATIPSSAAMPCSAFHAGETRISSIRRPHASNGTWTGGARSASRANSIISSAARRAEPPQPGLGLSEHLRREVLPKEGPQHPVVVMLVSEPRRLLEKIAHADLPYQSAKMRDQDSG